MLNLLYRPLIYLRIRTDEKYKVWVDFYLPISIALVLSIVLFWLYMSQNINVFAIDNKLISNISGFLQTLPGFFIAALAAIASFPSDAMGQLIPGDTPYLPDSNLASDGRDKLTRRRYLCYLFAYLTYISIIGFLFITFIVFLHSFSLNLSLPILYFGYLLSCLIFFFILTQIIFLTFIGLWYLGERIHINNPAS